MPDRTREEEFHALLLDLFGAEELRAFIALGPEGQDIAASLPPPPVSVSDLAAATVARLRQRGRVADCFERLLQKYPHRRAAIARVAARCTAAARIAEPAPAARPPGWDTPTLVGAAALAILALVTVYLGVTRYRATTGSPAPHVEPVRK